jgi:hypothetical protein
MLEYLIYIVPLFVACLAYCVYHYREVASYDQELIDIYDTIIKDKYYTPFVLTNSSSEKYNIIKKLEEDLAVAKAAVGKNGYREYASVLQSYISSMRYEMKVDLIKMKLDREL